MVININVYVISMNSSTYIFSYKVTDIFDVDNAVQRNNFRVYCYSSSLPWLMSSSRTTAFC